MKRLFWGCLAVLMFAGTAQAVERGPKGYFDFCKRHADQCKPAEPRTMAWPTVSALVRNINQTVNARMIYRPDIRDHWTLGGRYGDCEDYALTKRAKLMAAGIPPGALRLAVLTTDKGVQHAVLLVDTTAGSVVLDNRTNALRLWRDLSRYRLGSATSNPLWWVAGK